jgi:hypothetical protein
MTQVARPNADVLAGEWSPTPLYARLNEVSPDEVAVSSPDDPAGAVFEVKLQGLAWPRQRGAGTHRLKVRLRRTGPDATGVTLLLIQGQAVIASKEVQPGTTYQEEVIELSEAEVARVRDYADLRLRVVAGEPVVACCPGPLPVELTATFTGACEASGVLAWDGAAWRGLVDLGVGDVSLSVHCAGGVWHGSISGCFSTLAVLSGPCSPLSLTGGPYLVSAGCCGTVGNVMLQVTE